ncbi:MAG: hypothetical protein WBB84_05245, partial [Candidatus Omnitrophota bacterium]
KRRGIGGCGSPFLMISMTRMTRLFINCDLSGVMNRGMEREIIRMGKRCHCGHRRRVNETRVLPRGAWGEGQVRRTLSVIPDFKNRCHVIWVCRISGKMVANTLKMAIFGAEIGFSGSFWSFSTDIY